MNIFHSSFIRLVRVSILFGIRERGTGLATYHGSLLESGHVH